MEIRLHDVPCVGEPNVALLAVQLKAMNQVLLCIRVNHILVNDEQDAPNQLQREDDQEQNEKCEQQGTVFFDGSQAAEKAHNHHDGSTSNKKVGSREEWEGRREGRKIPLSDRQPNAHTQDATATEPEDQVEDEHEILEAVDAALSHVAALELITVMMKMVLLALSHSLAVHTGAE